MKRPSALLLLSATLLLNVFRGYAQVNPVLDPTLMTGWAGGAAAQQALEAKYGKATTTSRRSATTAAAYAYQPSPSARRQTVAQTAARLQPSNPQMAKALTDAFGPGKTDYDPLYAKIVQGTGLSATNAADALAIYMLLGYAIVHNIQDEKTIGPTQSRAVRNQLLPILTKTAIKPNNAVLAAKLGEEFKLQSVVLQSGWESAYQRNTLPAYQQSIRKMFQAQYGIDLSQYRLTAQGFVKS